MADTNRSIAVPLSFFLLLGVGPFRPRIPTGLAFTPALFAFFSGALI
jgi:hypothetical protein